MPQVKLFPLGPHDIQLSYQTDKWDPVIGYIPAAGIFRCTTLL